jgi:hypothetical protein
MPRIRKTGLLPKPNPKRPTKMIMMGSLKNLIGRIMEKRVILKRAENRLGRAQQMSI